MEFQNGKDDKAYRINKGDLLRVCKDSDSAFVADDHAYRKQIRLLQAQLLQDNQQYPAPK